MHIGISRAICAWAILAAVNCAGRRVNQFRDFAEAGRAYSDAMSELTKETGNAAIDADSAVLIASRDGLNRGPEGCLPRAPIHGSGFAYYERTPR
jgi:hypothetical protein